MANEFHLQAIITGKRSAVDTISRWAHDFQEYLTEDEKRRCNDFDSTADKNWMGLIPAVIDAFGYGSTHLGARAFCDGGSRSSIKDEVTVWFHSPDDCSDLWDFLLTADSGIDRVEVTVDPDYPEDAEEMGEELLYSRTRDGKETETKDDDQNRRKELDYMKTFAEQTPFDEELGRDQLRCLWTAYCFHQRLDADTSGYDKDLKELWDVVAEDEPETADWNDYDSFEVFMCRYLV